MHPLEKYLKTKNKWEVFKRAYEAHGCQLPIESYFGDPTIYFGLSGAFPWAETEQKYEFWRKLNVKYNLWCYANDIEPDSEIYEND